MDILKNISGSEYKDIVISLPKDKTWLEYLAHFLELKVAISCVEVLLPTVPKTNSGNKCFIVYDGFLKGYMEIVRVKETQNNDICVELIPYFTSVTQVPMHEIEGFKYFLDNSDMQ